MRRLAGHRVGLKEVVYLSGAHELNGARMNDPDVTALLADYIGLYTRDTLPRWRELFLSGFVATSINEDGSTTTRTLAEFYERQQGLFASGKPVSEVLADTIVQRRGSLASVSADFVWTDGEVSRDGQLMLLLVMEHGRLKIQALTFSYHG